MYNKIKKLCEENGTTITALCVLITNSKGNLATWKKNNFKSEHVRAIADHFHVSANFLLDVDERKTPAGEDGRSDEEQELINLYWAASPELRAAAVRALEYPERPARVRDTGEKD